MDKKHADQQRFDLLTKAMVGRYRLGYREMALFLAGTLFESLINSKLVDWDPKRIEKTTLEDKITAIEPMKLREDSLFIHRDVFEKFTEGRMTKTFSPTDGKRFEQVKTRLNNFRWLRNKVMHNQPEQILGDKSNIVEDMVVYLWSELATESFNKARGKRKDGQRKDSESIVLTLFEHTADYMVRAIDETEFLGRDQACGHNSGKTVLTSGDFDNLFDVRRKLVYLKNYLSDWLLREKVGLRSDVLTTIDTTSAYVWMPLVSSKLTDLGRRGVYDCSVSILATPLDLRIYMDFGGYTREQRRFFYDFLDGSPEYETVIRRLSGYADIEVFDIDWYSAIFNRHKLSDWLPCRDQALSACRDKIKSTPKPESSPITWNRCLHGYVLSKHDLPEGGVINFEMIEPKLRDIIVFYQAFENFKGRTLKGNIG